MLSARALAEKSADMPRRISVWLASCRSAPAPAVLSFAKTRSPNSAAASKRASASIHLERCEVCASSFTYRSSQMKVPKRHQLLPTGELHIVVTKTVNKMEGLLAACGASPLHPFALHQDVLRMIVRQNLLPGNRFLRRRHGRLLPFESRA